MRAFIDMRARVLTPFLVALALTACGSEKSSQPAPAQTPMPTPPSPAPDPAQPVPPMPTPPTPAADAPATDLARMSNRFALDLWAKTPPGNLAISPSSIATALTIAWGGAKGTTKEQMTKLLHLEGTPEAILSRWGNLSKSLAAPKAGMTLEIANRLYGEKTYPFDTIYFTIARKAFDVWIEPVDFVGDAEGVRQKINTWVAEQTEQKIKDLLPPRTVDASTALVIVNAIYFLADWATPFAPSATRPEDFFVGGKTAAKVPMMHRTGEYKLAHKDGAALLELPYTNNVAAMYVLLPDARDGLPAIEAKLADTMKALQPALAEQQVAVALPRFKLEASAPMSLRKPLEALGMTDAFDPAKADFTDIAKPKNERDKIAISEVLHKAFVKVDEKGTEAAAATAVVMPRGGRPPSPTQFVADHPFLFFIADRATGMILFIGRVVEPKE